MIDARTGAVIEECDVLRKATGRGRVFIPSPVVILDRDDLRDYGDAARTALAPAYRTEDLEGLEPGGDLRGTSVDTTNTPASEPVPTVRVHAHGRSDDHSYYDPSPACEDLTCGDGGVDDGEDAEAILESHFYLGPYADFKDGAEAIVMAERNLNGGGRTRTLTRTHRERGILQ